VDRLRGDTGLFQAAQVDKDEEMGYRVALANPGSTKTVGNADWVVGVNNGAIGVVVVVKSMAVGVVIVVMNGAVGVVEVVKHMEVGV
jgi:hypothetical protein